MAFFGLFGKRSAEASIKKHGPRVADKRAQAPDRWDSIQTLRKLVVAARAAAATDEDRRDAKLAIAALLPRFNFVVDPSITDDEEKEEVCRVCVEAGELAVEPVVAHLAKTDSLAWPLKILEKVGSSERVVAELLALLSRMDTEYERDPSRKLAVLQALEDRRHPTIAAVVLRFLDDVNEVARYHAAGVLLAQDDAAAHRPAFERLLASDESARVRSRILDEYATRRWDVGADRAAVQKALPTGWALDAAGVPAHRS